MPFTDDAAVHHVPMRWADIDMLNHVNNVVYVDYAAEARSLLGDEVARAPVRSLTVRYLRPLLLSTQPVVVRSSVDADTVTQQICSPTDDAAHAEVVTQINGLVRLAPQTEGGAVLQAALRRSDLDPSGAVSVTKLFELFQEARILFVSRHVQQMTSGAFVVGTVGVELARPLTWRPEPYDVRVRLTRVGAGSVTVESEILDGDTVLVRSSSVLVGFDSANQRSRRLGDDERAAFEAVLSSSR